MSLSDSTTDLDDFKTPKAINKVSKMGKPKPSKACQKRKRKGGTSNALEKFIHTNLQQEDVNPDHLQMALALSESSYEAENPRQLQSSQEKMESFKKALEKFGFGYKNKIPVENRRDLFEITKKNNSKKSRYRYVTPILKMRTDEDRQALISSKVTLILAQNERHVSETTVKVPTKLFSKELRKYRGASRIFCLNNLQKDDLSDKFLVKGLDIESGPSSCGCLLKDWGRIAGRDRSPSRPNDQQTSRTVDTSRPGTPCGNVSPDIFGSDDEYQFVLYEQPKQPSPVSSRRSLFEQKPSPPSSPLQLPPTVESKLSNGREVVFYDLSQSDDENQTETDSVQLLSAQLADSKRESSPEGVVCVDLSQSDDENEAEASQLSLANNKEVSCYDFSQSEDGNEAEAYPITISPVQLSPILEKSVSAANEFEVTCERQDIASGLWSSSLSIRENSNLNVTDYVNELLSQHVPQKLEKISSSEGDSTLSQESICISDEELNYSSVFSTPHNKKKYDLSDEDDISNPPEVSCPVLSPKTAPSLEDSLNVSGQVESPAPTPNSNFLIKTKNGQKSICISDDELNYSSVFSTSHHNKQNDLSDEDDISNSPILSPKIAPSLEDSLNASVQVESPAPLPPTPNSNFLIKTKNVTPMADYDRMDTPKIKRELDKFGLKPLKRQKGAKLLKYIYEATHPLVEDEEGKVVKKRKVQSPKLEGITGEIPEDDELIFERTQSKKVASCRVPLHIAWHNFVMSNPQIRDNILLYEPLQLEVLHSMLKEQGFKFNIQDLLTFLDRKCITIRTAQGQRHKKNS